MKYFIIEKDGICGCKDANGRWILPAEYRKIIVCNNFAICWKADTILLYNLETKSFVFTELEDIREDHDGYLAFKLDGKWGVMSTHGYNSGEAVLNNWYKGVKQLCGSLYCIYQDDYYEIANSPDCYVRHIDEYPTFYSHKRILAKKGGKYGFINSCNCTTIPFIYDEIIKRVDEDNFDVRIGDSWGLLSIEGKEIVPVKYKCKVFKKKYKDNDNIWKNEFCKVEDSRTGRVGIINREGKEIVPIIYNDVRIKLVKSMPKGWKELFPSLVSDTDSDSNVFLFYASTEKYSDYYDTFYEEGIYDTAGHEIVPVSYDSIMCEDNGLIFASNYQGQLFDIYRINGNGKRLLSNISRIHIDTNKRRLFLFGARRIYKNNDSIDVFDYCIPVDYDLKTLFKNKQGEQLLLGANTDLDELSNEYKIILGGIEQRADYLMPDYYSFLHGDSVVFNKDGKQGVCFISIQSFSQLYDRVIDQFEEDLFIINRNNKSGIYYKGKEILPPICYGISTIDKGFCFVIKENYSLYDIDMINIIDMSKHHITAFRGLNENDVVKIITGNFLYFKVVDSKVLFNDKCPYTIIGEFNNFISEERISLNEYDKVSWYWGIF